MIYRKPKNMKYTEMCIYIDQNAHFDNYEDQEITENTFIYLYLICDMFAKKYKWFNDETTYEEFSIFSATIFFYRLFNENLSRVKSILNYIKSSLYAHKAQFIKEQQKGKYQNIVDDINYCGYTLQEQMQNTLDKLNRVEFKCCMGDFIKTIQQVALDSKYSRDNVTLNNIYLSLLLTFLNQTTVEKNNDIVDIDLKNSRPVLYHLNDTMGNYIDTLNKKSRILIANDLSDILHTHIDDNSNLRMITEYEINGYDKED